MGRFDRDILIVLSWATIDRGPRARYWRRLLAAVGVVLMGATTWTHPALAASGASVAPDSVSLVDGPGIALHIPADGRLNGNGFAATVTGYRFASQVGLGPSSQVAARGQRLLVFGLSGAPLVAAVNDNGQQLPRATATLVVDGAEEALPIPSPTASSPTYYLASVPADAADVALKLAAQGFAQTFSFTGDAREGAQPAVLYRSASSWQAADPVNQTITLATPDPAESLGDAAVDITVASATLTWFGPDTVGSPTDPSTAWLVIAGQTKPHQTEALAIGSTLNYLSTLTGAQITLAINGTAIPALLTGQGGDSDETGSGLFGGVYYFPVPADLASATLTITPGTVQAEDSYLGHAQSIAVHGTARLPLSFGSVYQPPVAPASPPPEATAISATPTPASLSPAGRRSGGSGGGVPTGLIIAAAVVVMSGLVAIAAVISRRRRPIEASARPPAWLPPGAAIPPAEELAPPPPPTTVASPAGSAPPTPNQGAAVPLLIPPTAPPAVPDGVIEVQVLGPPRVVGWPAGVSPPGQSVLELLVYLALHPGERFTGEQLRAALGVGRDRDLDPSTIRRYANDLRRALGDQRVPEARSAGGYQVIDISTDAARFTAALDQARDAVPAIAAASLADALALVRAAPFANAPTGAYGWADTTALASSLANAVHRAGVTLATLALGAGDSNLAAWAVERAVVVWPTDETLHQLALTAAAASPEPSRLTQTWAWLTGLLGSHHEPVTDSLMEHYQRLRVHS